MTIETAWLIAGTGKVPNLDESGFVRASEETITEACAIVKYPREFVPDSEVR